LRDLMSRLGRWRVGLRWWLVAVSTGMFLLLTLAGLWLVGADLPTAADLPVFTGNALLGPVGFLLITLVAALGEEVGWRGYALPQLQRRFSPLWSTLILAPVWHVEFFVVESVPLARLVPYLFVVTCYAVVLTWLYNRSGGSILLVVVWHAAVNIAGLTGALAGIIDLLVIVQALALVALDLVARRRGRPSVLGDQATAGRTAQEVLP
jgi:membrane protease YdiL (CAAX protease family)